MPDFIYRLPNIWIMFLLTVAISVISIFIPIFIHNLSLFIPTEQSNSLGQSLFGSIATLTGLIIGFLLNQAQSSYREIENIVAVESGKINNLDRLLLRFGSEDALQIRIKIRLYIESIIDHEWADLQYGKSCHETHLLWRSISQDIFKLDPTTPKQLSLYGDIIDKQEEVAEGRELRIDRSTKSLPDFFWVVVLTLLSALVAVNTLFLRNEQFTVGLTILPIALGALISLLIITDKPFKGQNGIRPDELLKILSAIKTRTE